MQCLKNYRKFVSKLNLSTDDKKRMLSALDFAANAHQGQTRKSGEDYIIHPIAVSKRLWQLYTDVDLTIAGLLHDVVEDCESIKIADIYHKFGAEVGLLCDATNKLAQGFYHRNEVFTDKLDRLFFAGMLDIRVLLLKIADREHNLDTIKHLKDDKQIRMSFETQAVYEPLRTLLHYSKMSDLLALNKIYQEVADQQNRDPALIKVVFIANSFAGIDQYMFDIIYGDSHSVLWEISNRAIYDRICDTVNTNNIKFLELFTDETGVFQGIFINQGGVITNINYNEEKISINTYAHK